MRPFVIDSDTQKRIDEVVQYAESNPYLIDDAFNFINEKIGIAGDNPNHVCLIPVGYRVVYSIEKLPKWTQKHLSVSIDTDYKLPNIYVTAEIIKLFGFNSELENCFITFEKVSPERSAINIIEKIFH